MPTQFAGILNITPDSFSDGGKFTTDSTILKHTEKLIHDGANIIDIGAESTRPNATPLTHQQEWQRLHNILPKIIRLCHKYNVKASLDTRHPKSAQLAINHGINWINDVSGCTSPQMIDTIKNSDVHIVVMHNLGIPTDKTKILPSTPNSINIITDWAQKHFTTLTQSGIDKDKIIIDPGIGFGKNSQQSWNIIDNIAKLVHTGYNILVGHSRKSFLNCSQEQQDNATIAVSKNLISQGVQYLRVHNISAHKQL